MKVKEFIEILQEYASDKDIVVKHCYADGKYDFVSPKLSERELVKGIHNGEVERTVFVIIE